MGEKYWFRKRKGLFSKDLGWGWTPISKEGWIFIFSILAYILAFSFIVINLKLESHSTSIILLTNAFITILISVFVSNKKCRPEEK